MDKIFSEIRFGFKIFLFWIIIFFVERIIFIFFLREFLFDSSMQEIFTAIIYGTRLSLQTAGIFTLIILLAKLLNKKISNFIMEILIFATIILTFAAIPFYQTFHQNFNQMIFAGLNDDFFALFVTFQQEFNLISKIFLAIIFSAIIFKIFLQIRYENISIGKFQKIILIVATIFLANICFYGGSLSWQTELDFENIGVTKNNLLNESILDSFQAIHRAEILQNRIVNSQGLNFTAENVKALAKKFSGKNFDSENLDDYLKKSAKGAKISQPKQIFLIISESLANWTLQEKYSDLHMADDLKILAKNGAYCENFLPNGASTISAVTGIVTGFADANLYLTAIPESYAEIFPTSVAPQMQKLGYKTNFFYAGSATWEKIFDFTKAQGFKNFFSEGDIKNKISDAKGNVWGVDDKFLYQFVEKNLNFGEKNFSVILNTSNHMPYTVDLKSENIFVEDIKIGHAIYAEKNLYNFVKKMQALEPESLFIIVGDHADRFNIEKNPSTHERYCVPLIIFGCGVRQVFFAENCAGSQIDILPTIIELIAPKNFEYYSVGKSLSENIFGVNHLLFITKNSIGNANNFESNSAEIEDYINYVRGVSYWRVKHGKFLF